MSAEQAATPAEERRLAHGVAGFLAAFSLAGSMVGIAWHPLRLIPLSIFRLRQVGIVWPAGEWYSGEPGPVCLSW